MAAFRVTAILPVHWLQITEKKHWLNLSGESLNSQKLYWEAGSSYIFIFFISWQCWFSVIYWSLIICSGKRGSGSGINKLWPQGQICVPPVFVNKTLLKHSHVHLFALHLLQIAAFVLWWQGEIAAAEDCMGHKTEKIFTTCPDLESLSDTCPRTHFE